MTKERLEDAELKERISTTKEELKSFNNYRSQYITINVGYILDIIKQAERVYRLEEMLEGNKGMSVSSIKRQFINMHENLLSLKRQNKRYREALGFYAEGSHYYAEGHPDTRLRTVDYGEVAQEALEGEQE